MLIQYVQYLFLLHSPIFHIHITPGSFVTLFYRILCIQTHSGNTSTLMSRALASPTHCQDPFQHIKWLHYWVPPLISCKICHELYLILSKCHSTPIPQFHVIFDSHTLSYTAYSVVSISLHWELLIHICLQLLELDSFLFIPGSCAFQLRLLDNYIYQLPRLLPSQSPSLGSI